MLLCTLASCVIIMPKIALIDRISPLRGFHSFDPRDVIYPETIPLLVSISHNIPAFCQTSTT
jgi:hypothetical protein